MAGSSAENRPGMMERIAVLSVALGIAVMILAVAVMMGFKQEVSRKMAGFAAHATLTDLRSVNGIDAHPVLRTAHLESLVAAEEGFVRLAPYALKGGIVRTADAVEGVVLKGIDATYDQTLLAEWLTAGALPRIADSARTKDLLLSEVLARRLRLGVGDRVEMLFVEADEQPRRDRFRISGLYASGMEEMDRSLLITDLRNVQRLSNWTVDQITGYEIITSDLDRASEFAGRLDRTLLFDDAEETRNLAVLSLQERYPSVFDWLKAHDVNTAVVIVIMLVVAFFNMTSALLVLVLERTRMIGLLKALGMRNAPLRRIFLYRAAFIALRGLVWGNLFGVGCCLVQLLWHPLKLDAEGYLLSEVPVALGWEWLLVLNVGFVVTIVALLLIPTAIISTVKPDETIRYE